MMVVTSAQMKEIEAASLEYDLTYSRLMENAGSAAAAFIRRTFELEGLNCMVFCGKGNNGGDGFVVARKLYENGANVVVTLVEGTPAGEAPQQMLDMVNELQIPVLSLEEHYDRIASYLEHADILVDAIYGTGFHGRLLSLPAQAARLINGAIAAVIALDLPSGTEADTGHFDPDAVEADFTVALQLHKPVHIFPSSLALCGRVELVDIGIPPEVYSGVQSRFVPVDDRLVWSAIPQRDPESHKGTYGTLLSIAGSLHYRGAAVLSTEAALRTGAGLCCLASIEPVCAAGALRNPEAILLPLPDDGRGCIDADAARPLLAPWLSRSSAVLFGCGLGQPESALALLEHLLATCRVPMVIDADGLNALVENPQLLNTAAAPLVLTPHPGEMARLCSLSVAEVQKDRYAVALSFARTYNVTLVLKGHETVVASPDGILYLNATGNPGLARGGSGDLLAGMIASLLAQGVEPAMAAVCGVWLHGSAADRCAARRSQYNMLPSDILEDLGQLFLVNQR
ncbi:MAG: NAD(P)H-hydrate dehydratase [Oscillospiraceae bacterium]